MKRFYIFQTKPLVNFINLIFSTGRGPIHFKTIVVTSVYKSRDRTYIDYYHPIGVINNCKNIWKMLESWLLCIFKYLPNK